MSRRPRCRICRLPLDPVLVAERWTSHPTCDPHERRPGAGEG